tara:strand:+ start:5162 stop:5917 length:756 start_codon:yes stop_codon:yes gene_type:complete
MKDKLESLYVKYNIDNLSYGKVSDALGDLYEEYVQQVFSDENVINNFNLGIKATDAAGDLFHRVCDQYNIQHVDYIDILNVPKRESGGEPKTDVCVQINDDVIKFSVKQSYAKAIAVAEFNVNTIKTEIGITDKYLVSLMEKFQRDASGKNFKTPEKQEMTNRLKPHKDKFVRWVLSGAPEQKSSDLRIANHTIMFKLDKPTLRLNNFSTYTIEEQISKITSRSGGYGTGLSWTYATGTKHKKIQFKCPVI